LRRLALAAETSGATLIVYRPGREVRSFSPAALRIAVRPADPGLQLEIIKSRGAAGDTRLRSVGAGRA